MTDDYIDTPEKAAARLKKIRLLLTEADIPIVGDYRDREIEYIDPTPTELVVQVPLVEYFERVKQFKADRFQTDLCNRLQSAAANRHKERRWDIYHAESQLGKTTVLTQTYAAWLFGHDPLFRYALMMYNVTRSQEHSEAVIAIMNSKTHKDIFPDKDGWLESAKPSKAGWFTKARKERGDAQFSFNPCGLLSGLTGSGFDQLTIDDPYASEKEAFSDVTNTAMQNRYNYTVISRAGLHGNIAGMFHRYSPDDFAGYLLDTGEFDYIRYATVCDGSYVHTETGRKYDDPLGRTEGEYISPERRPPKYYDIARKNSRVWLSMFQGRPSSEEGDFFRVGQIATLTPSEVADRKRECSVFVRAWDLAATEAGGDYSVGLLIGMSADGRATVFDIVRKQVESAGRDVIQRQTAKKDGVEVVITIPDDPGAGGTTAVYHVEQNLKGFQVTTRGTSGSKEDRARSLASAVNSGMIDFATDEHLDDDLMWIKTAKKEMRDFPLSDHDDIVDAFADGYNEVFERTSKGLVVKNLSPQRNLVTWDTFGKYYGPKGDDQQPLSEIPKHWTIYVGVKITPEASKANSAIIVARAAQNAKLPDTLFIVAEYKKFDANYEAVFDWIDAALEAYCGGNKNAMIWLHADSEQYRQTIAQKLKRAVMIFEGDGGLTELNWYLKPNGKDHPFSEIEKEGANLYGLIADGSQLMAATDEYGLYAVRQEASTWGFNDKGEPSAVGSVLDCLSMICYAFRTSETGLTLDERVEEAIKVKSPNLSVTAIAAIDDQDQRDTATTKRMMEEKRIRQELNSSVRGAHVNRFARR